MAPRTLPRSPSRERELLGALIYRWPAALPHMPADFGPEELYESHHQAVVAAHLTLVQEGRRVDGLAVIEEITRAGDAGRFVAHGGVESFIFGLQDECATVEVLPDCLATLCGLAMRRRVMQAADEALVAAAAPEADADVVGPLALQAMASAVERRDGSRLIAAKEGVRDVLNGLQAGVGSPPLAVMSGIEALDDQTCGWRAGELVTVAGATGDGKSVLLSQVALDSEVPALIFSLEMLPREVWSRLLVQRACIDAAQVRNQRLDQASWIRLTRATDYLTREPRITVARGTSWTAEAIKSEALRWRALTGRPARAVIVVDYLQLIEPSPTKARRQQSREEEVAHAIRVLKSLAQAADCVVATASQLNDDGRVRESRRIEQDSDYLIQIEPVEGEEDLRDLVLRKARSARKGARVRVRLDGARLRISQHGDGLAPPPDGPKNQRRPR